MRFEFVFLALAFFLSRMSVFKGTGGSSSTGSVIRHIRFKANLLVHVLHEECAGLVVAEMMPDGISSTSESKSTGICWA